MPVKFRRRKPAPPEGTPEELALYKTLSDILQDAGVDIRLEKGDFRGGMCVVDGDREIFFLNKKHSLDARILMLVEQLEQRQLSDKLSGETLRMIEKMK